MPMAGGSPARLSARAASPVMVRPRSEVPAVMTSVFAAYRCDVWARRTKRVPSAAGSASRRMPSIVACLSVRLD